MTDTQALPVVAQASRPSAAPLWRTVLSAPFQARAWKEFAYLLAVFVLGLATVTYLFLGFGGGLLAAVTIVGIPLLALLLLGGRLWAWVYRALCRTLLDTPVEPPPPFVRQPGLTGFLKSAFTDRPSWRTLLFLVLQFPLGVVLGYLAMVLAAMIAFLAVSPIIWGVLRPVNVDEYGVERQSMMQFGTYYVDTWPRVLGVGAVGVLLCFAVPWLFRSLCLTHRALTLALLSATVRDKQLAELRESRRVAVDDAAATLRRVERDLHDGTQARLVTIAMALGRAEERLATGGDPHDLIADAHASSKEALTELRELVRGIHPPALELGLAPALETLTSRCAVPVDLRVGLPERPSPAIEAIAYFSVAELLTNVVKHARADRVWVSVVPHDARTLAVTVRDNGIGGVLPPGAAAGGSGLSGLAARARAVEGTLTVDSPAGGPTVVTMLLPKVGP
ncbi:sensor domain-containing protein [Nocardia sp. NPDC048505]|uniref:sensor histidine kinase n=1 Tax=unclassified Nocardia TaxID=2637762 RepID=UPI0033F23488